MAHIRQRGRFWRAEVSRRGIRRGEEFSSREEAEQWASECERAILADVLGGKESAIELDGKEVTALFVRARERAKQRGIEFHLTRDDIVALFGRSYGVCQVTSITFNRFRPEGSTKRPWYPSLDRIDSRKPYTKNNCRFVCVAVNIALGEWGEWVLNAIAKALVYGAPGILKQGKEAEPYKFGKIVGEPTYRQLVRRRIRAKTTHQEPTGSVTAE